MLTTTRTGVIASAITLSILPTACGSSSEASGGAATPPEGSPSVELKSTLPGRLYLLAGPDETSDNVYRVVASDERSVRPITHFPAGAGISNFSVAGERIAVHMTATGSDTVATARLVDGEAKSVRGYGRGSLPAVRDDGALAYLRPAGGKRFRRVLVIRMNGRRRTLRLRGSLSASQWVGRRLVTAVRRRQMELVVDVLGRRRRIRTTIPEPGLLAASANGALAYGYVGRIWLRTPGRAARELRIPWKPLAWSPDGKTLLVANLRHELGLLTAGSDTPTSIGRVRGGGLRGAAWTE